MKVFNRGIAFILTVCILLTLLPPLQFAGAAEVVQRYELDTDGIDPGATYLIVNAGTAGNGNALRFYYNSIWSRDLRNQTLTIQKEDGVTFIETGFTNEEDCQFQFTGTSAGTITHGNYSVNLEDQEFNSGTSGNTLSFTNVGNGQYRIHYSSWFRTYYLRYNNSDWSTTTSATSVYLYKLTEHIISYDVTFDGNGYTSGTLPQNVTDLSKGKEFVVPAPSKDLRKDVGEDTWLFQCWNTAPDGSGTEYKAGEVITITEDVTLYVDWYQQTKHSVSMITYMDGVATDVDKFAGYNRQFFAKLEGGDGSYITLNRTAEGTYSAKVVENGIYTIYAITADGKYEPVHGHTVVIYNNDGTTECMHYSVTYDTNGGTWAEGEAPAAEKHHYGEPVTVYDKIPTKAGYEFKGWGDQKGNVYAPEQLFTAAIDDKVVLTAIWEEQISVTVNVTIDHTYGDGFDQEQLRQDVSFTLFRVEGNVNLPVAEKTLTSQYNPETNVTTYQVVFADMPKGVYHVSSAKSNYETTITYGDDFTGDQTIDVNLKFAPQNKDLHFDVKVNGEKELMPKAVNVKITCWGFDDERVLGWHTISQQLGDNAPVTVTIDENGEGTGYFPVWRYWNDGVHPYFYRVEVTSYVMPDDSIVPAVYSEGIYTVGGSHFYEGVVSIVGQGGVPDYPDDSDTDLPGAYFNGEQQMGRPLVTVTVNPFTVTFDAGNGTINKQQTLKLENQYRYPALHEYIAVPNAEDRIFICWTDAEGNPVTDMSGQFLTGNVTYYARYNENITLSGTVAADAVYDQDGNKVQIHDIDRVDTLLVVLQKKVGDVYNDVDSVEVKLVYQNVTGYDYLVGLGNYKFENLPNDGTEYRVHVLALNYKDRYDNNADTVYTEEEAVAVYDMTDTTARVDIHLDWAPDVYEVGVRVDASQIHEDLRPTNALAQILYRDLGDVHNYQVISQHTVDPYGLMIPLNASTASGMDVYDVWNWHTGGAPYEYQVQVSTLYGNNVTGAYSQEGTAYTDNSPFTIVYGPSNNYLKQMLEGGVMLEATLVPKEYTVNLDLNLGDDTTTPVYNMNKFMVDDDSGQERYAFTHTWSYAESFTAYPYREGYVFKGWSSPNTDDVYIQDGVVHVGNTLANDITLTAQWEKMHGTDYTILYLELNTDEVLRGATMVSGAVHGDRVVAAEKAVAIDGFFYAGALVNDEYIDKADNPAMTITDDPVKNLMVLYYLPDGSDGYTEQVESNLDINKTATLEDDGTYTITMDTWTKDNPITTLIQQNTPLDIVLVLDQSGSLAANNFEYLNALQDAVDNFVESVADHGRHNEVDHRIAMVGYAGDASDGHSSDPVKATGGKETDSWINTGVFDSNGEFHLYNVNGFNYTEFTDTKNMKADGIYYTKVTTDGNPRYLLLTHHDEYRHLITEEEARVATIQGQDVFGYVYNEQGVGGFVKLTRNNSGLWLYGNKQLYSEKEFFTYHTDVWTHRDGTSPRQIHAYGVGAAYKPVDGHEGVYTREETTGDSFEHDIYVDALIPVSVGAAGSGGTNPGLLKATQSLGADGATRASYGMEMANAILSANPVDDGDGRVRLVVMFTDGEPGYLGFNTTDSTYYNQAVAEANNAIKQAYISKNTHDAYVYTIGLYESAGVEATSDVAYYMNALSSNYPKAQDMDDIKAAYTYVQAKDGTPLENNGKFFVMSGNTYYDVRYGYVRIQGSGYRYCWYYKRGNNNISITTASNPVVSDGKVNNTVIYQRSGGYAATDHSGYYATTESSEHLRDYFENVLRDITTKITTEIILDPDTILRDIMNQGLVMTNDTVISVFTQEGNYDLETGEVNWAVDDKGNPVLVPKVSLALNSGETSAEGPSPGLDKDGKPIQGVEIITYNLDAANPTDPTKSNYAPHTVDITGYDFHNWYISKTHPTGHKMIVKITRVEARDNVQWGRSTATNHERSGLWLPADDKGNRQLLLPFDQPTTIFVERAYVLDYGKEFTLSGWYFDNDISESGELIKNATPVHLDCDIASGMNGFDSAHPNIQNSIGGVYGNTKYGNVQIKDGEVIYSPTSMNWGSYDQFYVFGDTWRKPVLAQDANQNGNLWNKVTVIPANNIYYEDSFITTQDTTKNGIEGFTFSGDWEIVFDNGANNAGQNTEKPENLENAPYGDVHGWTDSLGDDRKYTDGSAHAAGLESLENRTGATAQFTFTGTGVDIFSRTNSDSGLVIAFLYRHIKGADGKETLQMEDAILMDDLAASGDYYHIPTISFEVPYDTYTVELMATMSSDTVTGEFRYEYYLDGVRVYNPLGPTTNYYTDVVKDAYGLENNAVFREVRDILLEYEDFNTGLLDSSDPKIGAVFIDWIREGQGSNNDQPGTAQKTYEVGTFEDYGPKNEVYLSAGQAIVMRVAEENNYYVGLKSLTGAEVTANVSGIDQSEPTAIKLSHTTDLYYQVTPVNGYIVIQNGNTDDALLSITNLRTTNLTKVPQNGGVLAVTDQEAVQLVTEFTDYLMNKPAEEVLPPQPEEQLPSPEEQAQANQQQATVLFTDVRQWLENN